MPDQPRYPSSDGSTSATANPAGCSLGQRLAAYGLGSLSCLARAPALAFRILWGFYPAAVGSAVSVYAVRLLGIDYLMLIAIGIGLGILATKIWQRCSLFIAGERVLETINVPRLNDLPDAP